MKTDRNLSDSPWSFSASLFPVVRNPRWWKVLLYCLIGIVLFWQIGPLLWQLVNDQQRLTAVLQRLGWLGPVALIVINALQIIVAPIPGYVVQLVAGFLYGPWWGGLWAAIGQMIGSTLAMGLARTYGRPLVERLVEPGRLSRWESIALSHHALLWVVLIVAPTGDLPYFLAGLAGVSYVKIALITLLIRVPSVFVAAAVGAGVMWLTWWQLSALFLGLGAILLLFLWQQERLLAWVDGQSVQVSKRLV